MSDIDESEIKYCPFCGSKKIKLEETSSSSADSEYIIACSSCQKNICISIEEVILEEDCEVSTYDYLTGDEIEDYSEFKDHRFNKDFLELEDDYLTAI